MIINTIRGNLHLLMLFAQIQKDHPNTDFDEKLRIYGEAIFNILMSDEEDSI